MPTYRVLFQSQCKRVLRVFAPSAGDAERHVKRLFSPETPNKANAMVRREPENQQAKALGFKIVDICQEEDGLNGGCGARFMGGEDY